MTWTPQLNITCGRCGKPRTGIRHDCITSSGRVSGRRATLRLDVGFGKCPKCKKALGNPFTHVCAPKSDFKKRRRAAEKREQQRKREAARKKRQAEKHDYRTCKDDECKRSLCVAFKSGWKEGHDSGFTEGYETGWPSGYAEGYPDGIAACPRPHSGGG